MVMAHRVLVLFAETPVHAGGSDSLGMVDLPIQREVATRLPVIWGQSLKGALRDALRGPLGEDDEVRIFGSRPPTGAGAPAAGSRELRKGGVAVGDAQLLLFPAPTLVNTFAWVTSPQLLARLRRKLALLGVAAVGSLELTRSPDTMIIGGDRWNGRQALGPFVQAVGRDDALAPLATALATMVFPTVDAFGYARRKLATDLLVVADGVLSELAESGTEIVARVQLGENKTVQNGPFYSEHLPAESVLVALLSGEAECLDRVTVLLDGQPLQIGGDETIGKGIVWCRVHDESVLADTIANTSVVRATL